VWWVWSFFSLLHPALFLQCLLTRVRSIRTCRNGIRGRCGIWLKVSVLALPLLCGRLPLWCVAEYIRQLEVRRITSLTHVVLFLCLWFETGPFVVVCIMGLVFLFFVAPISLRAVFEYADAFNQDVSNWITGLVTTMQFSTCTLPLCGHGAFCCGGVLLNIYDNSSSFI